MNEKVIPLVLTRDEAYALIDLWESWREGKTISHSRYESALRTVEWLRLSVQVLGKPTRYPLRVRLIQAWRNFRLRSKYRFLVWKNKHQVIDLPITESERIALLRLLVLHKPQEGLSEVIERLDHAKDS